MGWVKIGNLKGPKGSDGAVGAIGPQGAVGPIGPIGPAGATGPAGVNATTTANATTTTAGLMSPESLIALGRVRRTAYVATTSKTVSNSLTEITAIPAGKGSLIVPGALLVEGTTFDFDSSGVFGVGVTGLLNLRVKMGSIVTATLMSVDLPKVVSGLKWFARGTGTVRGSNKLVTQAYMDYEDITGKLVSQSFSESEVTINPLQDYTVDFTAQWTIALLASSFTVTQLRLFVTPPPA